MYISYSSFSYFNSIIAPLVYVHFNIISFYFCFLHFSPQHLMRYLFINIYIFLNYDSFQQQLQPKSR